MGNPASRNSSHSDRLPTKYHKNKEAARTQWKFPLTLSLIPPSTQNSTISFFATLLQIHFLDSIHESAIVSLGSVLNLLSMFFFGQDSSWMVMQRFMFIAQKSFLFFMVEGSR
jgi:hypothetical protein